MKTGHPGDDARTSALEAWTRVSSGRGGSPVRGCWCGGAHRGVPGAEPPSGWGEKPGEYWCGEEWGGDHCPGRGRRRGGVCWCGRSRGGERTGAESTGAGRGPAPATAGGTRGPDDERNRSARSPPERPTHVRPARASPRVDPAGPGWTSARCLPSGTGGCPCGQEREASARKRSRQRAKDSRPPEEKRVYTTKLCDP